MKKINYEVEKNNGLKFYTSDYEEANKIGKIIRTYFTEIDERSEKTKERMQEHAKKIKEKFNF